MCNVCREHESEEFPTGAVRQPLEGTVRYDLISPYGLRRLAATYAEGAVKYSDNNWRMGFPASNLINHVLYHIVAWLGGEDSIKQSEDHLAHAAWGLFALMEQDETHPELDERWFGPRGHFGMGSEK